MLAKVPSSLTVRHHQGQGSRGFDAQVMHGLRGQELSHRGAQNRAAVAAWHVEMFVRLEHVEIWEIASHIFHVSY